MIRRILTGGRGHKPSGFERDAIEKAGRNAPELVGIKMRIARALSEYLELPLKEDSITLHVSKLGTTGELTMTPDDFIGDAVTFSLKAQCPVKLIGAHEESELKSWRRVFKALGLHFSPEQNDKGKVARDHFIYSVPEGSIAKTPEQALQIVHNKASIAVHYASLCKALGIPKEEVDEIRNNAMKAKAQEFKVSFPAFMEEQKAHHR